MKLLRIGEIGHERTAVLIDGSRAAFLESADAAFDIDDLLDRGRKALENPTEIVELDHTVRIGAPLRPGKIICVGLNYADHAREGGQEAPAEPILFLKAPDTVVGPNDDVLIPRGAEKTDWEVELGVVIGAFSSALPDQSAAAASIAGYVLCNDVSERHFQLERGGQWAKGKNCATFFPMGPYLVTAEEIGDPQNISLGLDVDDHRYQDSSTSEMIFGVEHLVWYISQFIPLYPGDVISTGTPAGVGAGQRPERYLRPGNVMRTWAEGLGAMTQNIRQA